MLQILSEILFSHHASLKAQMRLRIFLGNVVLQQVEVGRLGTART